MASFIQGIKFTARQPDSDTPLSFGKVYTYDTGTTSFRVTYKDEDKTIPNTNPVILNAFGQADICLDGKYRIVVTDEHDNVIDVTDPISDVITQFRDMQSDTQGLGTSVLYDAGVNYGQLMIVGDGTSLGKSANYPSLINPNVNLNAVPMQFKIWHGNGAALTNAPTNNPITIMQIPNGNGTAVQICYDLTTGKETRRIFNGTTWGAWIVDNGIGTLAEFNTGMGA